MSDSPTLNTLRATLYQAGLVAAFLATKYRQPGRTSEVVDEIQRELQRCSEVLDDEIKQLKKWGDAQ
jgi:hypothetical protein